MQDPRELAREVAERLGRINGVLAVVLGGSQARGDADATSDIDLGIYYHPERPPSRLELRALALEVDDHHRADAVTDLGGWGPWINGGAWLDIRGVRVDWLYRDVSKVEQVIADCRQGIWTSHYQPGHPHAFHSHIYMGEAHLARPLFDPHGTFARLQALTTPYPEALMKSILQRAVWEAGFALETSHKAIGRGDVFYVSGCFFRSVAMMVQALFALNARYCINEKRSVPLVADFPVAPARFSAIVTEVLASLGADASHLRPRLHALEKLVAETKALCQAKFPEL